MAFDKTGTLTHGEPAVVEVRAVGGISGKELLGLVASAEQYSSHVLARSLIEAAHTRGVLLQAADTASEVATDGVRATNAGREVAVGKERFVAEHAANVPAAVVSSGQLAVYVSIDKAFAGTDVLSDRIRENAAATLAALASQGVEHTLLLTGDAASTAAHIAAELGIRDVRAELLPIDKVTAIKGVTGRPVVMVGDGVNDAPVLAVADVGIAMGAKGSTAASESADEVIMVDDLSRVAQDWPTHHPGGEAEHLARHRLERGPDAARRVRVSSRHRRGSAAGGRGPRNYSQRLAGARRRANGERLRSRAGPRRPGANLARGRGASAADMPPAVKDPGWQTTRERSAHAEWTERSRGPARHATMPPFWSRKRASWRTGPFSIRTCAA